MVVPHKENIETVIKLGIQLKTKNNYSKEKAIVQNKLLEENQSLQVQLLSSFLELIEEEELLF